MITKACVIIYDKEGTKYTIPCHRHSDAYWILSQFLSPYSINKNKTIQGFLDEKHNFLDRHEAYLEALKCDQIKEKKDETLYSEDLW